MRKSFQTAWQDIAFSDFIKTSSWSLAGPEFYQAFYEEFFKRYQGWEQLPPSWRKEKERCAEFVLARRGVSSTIFSVGCGLGAMEHYMRAREPRLDLFIHEVAPSAWRWVGVEFPEQRKFLGLIPACLPEGLQFDLIYLSAVDYALGDDALVGLLAALRPFMRKAGGECLLISASFQAAPVTLVGKATSLVREMKAFAAAVGDICGVRPRGQFWGWTRTREDYQALIRRAGYGDIQDGFIDQDKNNHYWISGR